MGTETALETSGGALFAQLALAILGYMWPATPQWARGAVALAIGILSGLAGELRRGLSTMTVLAALTIGGQGLFTAALALGLVAGIGAAQERRAIAAGPGPEAGRHEAGI